MPNNSSSNDSNIFFFLFWDVENYRAFFEDTFLLLLYLTKSLTWELFHLSLGTRWASQDWKCLQGQHIRPASGGNDFRLPMLLKQRSRNSLLTQYWFQFFQFCFPAQLRQQTEELCATIDKVLQDSLSMVMP